MFRGKQIENMEEACKRILELSAFGVSWEEKENRYIPYMKELTEYHRNHCNSYDRILQIWNYEDRQMKRLCDFPMIPVSLFKEFYLSSVEEEQVFKILTSSGTTGQLPSRIILDSRTADLQQQILYKIVKGFMVFDSEKGRFPMLILDSQSVLKNRSMFSARGAGILGFSIFSSERCFALDENMKLDIKRVEEFLERHRGKNILVFGFTYIIWLHIYEELKKKGKKLDLSKGFLIHGGGWKKLKEKAVSKEDFAQGLYQTCRLEKISNYYGMAEQTGTIYMECEQGHFHVSAYSEVIFRNMRDFSLCQPGEEGVIQVLSPAALSYPGHNLLTEDKGYFLGRDDCPCGRQGTYFKITGRIQRAEIRGCSDVYEGEKLQ